ncbi:alpha-ketoglutarate-dependent dioxygenase AlkB [Bacteriovorax stolpii]|uniref:Alpha-ketoglutarate-dependent dioxygenase AlkB n=1 Tax=Bacteriovorax stolpii TaxID=960 RepID=A0A2K9NQZ6_BACTC|nr:alpha-ketoglutarate-dependent dioxygenase AlkB [Bacteriovorax stolpii]AUN97174.1 alpha-ketoglutarate-dependent dioxygenase AlkB [Bacteriovorax stolpii]TDP53460.1 alkylated DNA repair dioxygenase AlkB [Bacteriovorax stolpii]
MNFLPKGFIDIITEDGTLQYFEQYSDIKIDDVIEGIKWRNDSITLYGKTFPQPRLTAWYGDPGVKYSYSNIHMQALPWTPVLLKLKTQLENDLNVRFNSVLVNYYRDGNDHMSYHSDDEKELGPNPTIASLSFGETRSFQLKHKFDLEKKTVIIPITDGSLVVMKDELQHFWQHKISKTKKIIGPRVNLTFRMIY